MQLGKNIRKNGRGLRMKNNGRMYFLDLVLLAIN